MKPAALRAAALSSDLAAFALLGVALGIALFVLPEIVSSLLAP